MGHPCEEWIEKWIEMCGGTILYYSIKDMIRRVVEDRDKHWSKKSRSRDPAIRSIREWVSRAQNGWAVDNTCLYGIRALLGELDLLEVQITDLRVENRNYRNKEMERARDDKAKADSETHRA